MTGIRFISPCDASPHATEVQHSMQQAAAIITGTGLSVERFFESYNRILKPNNEGKCQNLK